MTKWNVKFLPEALNDLRNLDNSTRKRILSLVPKLESDPMNYGEALGNKFGLNLTTFYKITPVDGYRVIYSVQKKEVIVIVLAVGKRERGKVYKTAPKRIEMLRTMTNDELKKLESLLGK